MSGTTVIENHREPLGDLLAKELNGTDVFYAASAFLNSGGLAIIEPSLRRILEFEGEVSIVHGADFRITDPDAVRSLAALKARYGTMSYFVHCDWSLLARQAFHPKLYITTADYQRYCAIVGSSNLTLGGLRSNIEVNAVIRGDDSEEPVRRCLDIFDSILASTALVEPDLEFAEKYAYLYERTGDLPLTEEPPSDLAPLYEELTALWRKEPKTDVGWPRTQTDFVAQAIANLTAGDVQMYAHLSDIYVEAERLARGAGVAYDWSTFENSVRGRLNENTLGLGGRDLFERRGGSAGRFGEYRLSRKGTDYVERKR